MSKPRLLDLFCCQGGAGAGYAAAGFEVVGVDCDSQPNYPFEFHQGDAMTWPLDGFDVVHASPPCQDYSMAQRIRGNVHPRLIAPMRERLLAWGGVYVIENVEEAAVELIDPVRLCGAMFGLRTFRHRLFESNHALTEPLHPAHGSKTIKMGRPLASGDYYHAVGNFSGVAYVRNDLGVPWMNRDGIRECVPPAYTRALGQELRRRTARANSGDA